MTPQSRLRDDPRWRRGVEGQDDKRVIGHIAVEGPDDKHVVGHIASLAGLDLEFNQVIDCGGIHGLLEAIETILVENRDPVGIIVDSNQFPIRRWKAVTDRLSKIGIDAPSEPDPKGTVIPETDLNPRVGIWLMPDNKSSGELEHFVAKMIPDGDPVWPRSKAYIEGIPIEHRRFGTKEIGAKVLSWIATLEEPGFMGQAIARGDLNTDTPLCQTFTAWLNRLFADPTPSESA